MLISPVDKCMHSHTCTRTVQVWLEAARMLQLNCFLSDFIREPLPLSLYLLGFGYPAIFLLLFVPLGRRMHV